MSKPSLKDIDIVIAISDLHCGCQMGLCPPGGFLLDSGGKYKLSRTQKQSWTWWREFWGDWVPTVTSGRPYAIVLNGDAMDGRHHGSTTQISQNLADQQKIADAVLRPVINCKKVIAYYHIRGTEAHSGPSGEQEEQLAKALGAVPRHGNYARNELLKMLGQGKNQYLLHFAHHIGTTSSASYESTAVHKELVSAYLAAARWGRQLPDAIIRGHRHRFLKTEWPTKRDRAISIVLPGWQGKTPFIFRTGMKMQPPQFGGVMLRVSDEGELYERHFVKSFQSERPE